MSGEPDRDGDEEEPSVEELLERGGDMQGENDPFIAGVNELLPEGWDLPGWAGTLLAWGLFGMVIVAVILGAPFALDLSQGPADLGGTYENLTTTVGDSVPSGYYSFEGSVGTSSVAENGTVVVNVTNEHNETYAVELVGVSAAGASNETVEPARYDLEATAENRSCVVTAGEEARSMLDGAEGQSVQVLANASSVNGEDDRDARGYIVVGDRTVGLELIGHGVATGEAGHAYTEEYAQTQSAVQNESVGAWSCPDYKSLEEVTGTESE